MKIKYTTIKKIIDFNSEDIYIFTVDDTGVFLKYFMGIYIRDVWYSITKKKKFDLESYSKQWELIKETPLTSSYMGLFFCHKFLKGFFNDFKNSLSPEEEELRDYFIDLGYYRIGKNKKLTVQKKKRLNIIVINEVVCMLKEQNWRDIVDHELAHFVYENDKDYKKYVDKTFDGFNKKYGKAVHNYLRSKQYHEPGMAEEWAARAVEQKKDFVIEMAQFFNKEVHKIEMIKKKFKEATEGVKIILHEEMY